MGSQELAAIVRLYREKRGWSQNHLAAQAGMSQAFISRLEAGDYRTAEPPRLQKLADVLGAPLQDLLQAAGMTNAPYRPPATPPLPPPEARYPRGLAWVWERLTPEEQAQVEDHARWLWSRRARRARRAQKDPVPEPEPAHDEATTEGA